MTSKVSTADWRRAVSALFLGLFTFGGVLLAGYWLSSWRLGAEPFLAPGNALIYLVFVLPLLASLVGRVCLSCRWHVAECLGLLALFWFVLAVWEIVEDSARIPRDIFILTMLLVSVLCMGYLVLTRRA